MKSCTSSVATRLLFLLLTLIFTLNVKCAKVRDAGRISDGVAPNVRDSLNKNLFLQEILINGNLNATNGTPIIRNISTDQLREQILAILSAGDALAPATSAGISREDQDQGTSQSQTVLLAVEDLKDLGDLDHVLTVSEYEPQKIDRKAKRRTHQPSNNRQSYPAELYHNRSDEMVSEQPPAVDNVYYEVPRKLLKHSKISEAELLTTATLLQDLPRITNRTVNPGTIEDNRYYEVPRKFQQEKPSWGGGTDPSSEKESLSLQERAKEKFNGNVASAGQTKLFEETKRKYKKVPSWRLTNSLSRYSPSLSREKKKTYSEKVERNQPESQWNNSADRAAGRLARGSSLSKIKPIESPESVNAEFLGMTTKGKEKLAVRDLARAATASSDSRKKESSSANHNQQQQQQQHHHHHHPSTTVNKRKRKKFYGRIEVEDDDGGRKAGKAPLDDADADGKKSKLLQGEGPNEARGKLLAKHDASPRGFGRPNRRATNFHENQPALSSSSILDPPTFSLIPEQASVKRDVGRISSRNFTGSRVASSDADGADGADGDRSHEEPPPRPSVPSEITVNPILSYINNPTSVSYEELRRLMNPKENYRMFTSTFAPYSNLKKSLDPRDKGNSSLPSPIALPGSKFLNSYQAPPPNDNFKFVSSLDRDPSGQSRILTSFQRPFAEDRMKSGAGLAGENVDRSRRVEKMATADEEDTGHASDNLHLKWDDYNIRAENDQDKRPLEAARYRDDQGKKKSLGKFHRTADRDHVRALTTDNFDNFTIEKMDEDTDARENDKTEHPPDSDYTSNKGKEPEIFTTSQRQFRKDDSLTKSLKSFDRMVLEDDVKAVSSENVQDNLESDKADEDTGTGTGTEGSHDNFQSKWPRNYNVPAEIDKRKDTLLQTDDANDKINQVKKFEPIRVKDDYYYEKKLEDDQAENPSVRYNARTFEKEIAEESAELENHRDDQRQDNSDNHQKLDEAHHDKDKNFEEGGGIVREDENHGIEKKEGHEGYKSWHEHEEGKKGHHDKEEDSGHHEEKDGKEKKHEEEEEHHSEHHEGDEGEKAAKFEENGKHEKGHSTKGQHSVHKKDEFEKKTEFYDEFHEDGDIEKEGEYQKEHKEEKGGHEKVGHHDGKDHEDKYGKEEKYAKGGHYHDHKGHKAEEGHDGHYQHEEKYGEKEAHEDGKKWAFKKGDGNDKKHKE